MDIKEEGKGRIVVVDGNGEAFRTTERVWNGMESLQQ